MPPEGTVGGRWRWRTPLMIALIGAVGAVAAMASGGIIFPLDDAYITLHNAQALLAGGDEAYAVSPLTGATSLAHLALVAGLMTLLPQLWAGLAAAALGFAAYVAGVLMLAKSRGLSPLWTALLLLAALGSGEAAFHLMSGLETTWAMAAVTWAIVLADRPRFGLAALCGLMPFIRPELAALSAGLMLRQAWQRREIRSIVGDVAVALAIALPFLLWSWWSTGTLLPNTIAAKAAFFADAGQPLRSKLTTVVVGLFKGLGVLLAAVVLQRRDSLRFVLWAFVLIFLTAFAMKLPSGLFHNFYRYQWVVLPIALLGMSERKLVLGLMAACAALTLPMGLSHALHGREVSRDALEAGAWARTHLPPGSHVLVHDAGAFAFTSGHPLADMVGLKTPASVAAHLAYTAPSLGAARWRALDQIARESGAEYVEVLDQPFWRDLASDLRRGGWSLSAVRGRPGGYWVYRLTPPT